MSKVIDRYVLALAKQKRREAILAGRTRFENVTEVGFDLEVVPMTQEEFRAQQPLEAAEPIPEERRIPASEHFRIQTKVRQQEIIDAYRKHVDVTYRMALYDLKRLEAIHAQAE